jgi:hypothetical protein
MMNTILKVTTLAATVALTSCVTVPSTSQGLSGSIAFGAQTIGNGCQLNGTFTNRSPIDLQPVVALTVLDKEGNTLHSDQSMFGMIAPTRQQKMMLTFLVGNQCSAVKTIAITGAYDIDAPTIPIQGVVGRYSK